MLKNYCFHCKARSTIAWDSRRHSYRILWRIGSILQKGRIQSCLGQTRSSPFFEVFCHIQATVLNQTNHFAQATHSTLLHIKFLIPSPVILDKEMFRWLAKNNATIPKGFMRNFLMLMITISIRRATNREGYRRWRRDMLIYIPLACSNLFSMLADNEVSEITCQYFDRRKSK